MQKYILGTLNASRNNQWLSKYQTGNKYLLISPDCRVRNLMIKWVYIFFVLIHRKILFDKYY